MEVKSNVRTVFIRKTDIDSYVLKDNVIILRMKNNKTWICDKSTDLNQKGEFISIILATKGKSE